MDDLLDRMRRNPAGDWAIRDFIAVWRHHRIGCDPPCGGGSHYKVTHSLVADILTIPFKRPIKPVYIRKLIAYLELVRTL